MSRIKWLSDENWGSTLNCLLEMLPKLHVLWFITNFAFLIIKTRKNLVLTKCFVTWESYKWMSQIRDEHGQSLNKPWWMGNLPEPAGVDVLEDIQSVLFSS